MESIHDQDLIKIKELLRHTGEFIAYFELAESKMLEWRHDLELQIKNQQHRADQQLQNLHKELESLQEVLTQAGLARFRLSAAEALSQGEAHVNLLQKTSQQMVKDLNTHHADFTSMIAGSLSQIEQHASQLVNKIDNQLAKYDAQHFHRIANESVEIVQKTSADAVMKSTGLLKKFQWRAAGLAVLATILTTFAIGLYVSNEMPWDIHQQAMNEREAGRLLIKAWPILSHQEKTKILNGRRLKKS